MDVLWSHIYIMNTFFKIIYESFVQAYQQLTANRLRSFLSLFGISIGIFCIIGIASAIDSLEYNIRRSFEQLGDDIISIDKFSWAEDPGPNFLKYMRRPNPSYDDFKSIREQVKTADQVCYAIYVDDKPIKYRSNNVQGAITQAVTQDFAAMFKLEFDKGRFFSPAESNYGSPKIILGYKIAESLFGTLEPIGKTVKVGGHKLEVVGVLKEMGEGLTNVFSYDRLAFVSYEKGKKMANLNAKLPFGSSSIKVKAAAGVSNARLSDDITGVLRATRRLKPVEENNFSLNELSVISQFLDSFFGVLTKVGVSIGIFAIFVGAFGIANIMFVSVKERTSIIGVKKALGAKQYVILIEFLVEAIILCLLGGLVGLGLVLIGVEIFGWYVDFIVRLSSENIFWGLFWSIAIGVVAGFIPALRASRLDPVVAMRA